MSTREIAVRLINELPDEKINAFLTLFADKNTMARIESEILAHDPDAPRYSNIDDLFEELCNDDKI